MPLISVLMTAFNAASTLAASFDSVVAQTFKDFELVLIDDGSSDDTVRIAESYRGDLQLRIIRHEKNLGVAGARNTGLRESSSEFVAYLDADDLASPERLEKQVAFMRANEGVDICGTFMDLFIEKDGTQTTYSVLTHPTSHAGIATALVQRCSIAHGSVLARRKLYDDIGVYDPRYDCAEDYELWCRAAVQGRQFANIAESLSRYRQHDAQVSRQKAQLQFERDLTVKRKYLMGWLDGGAQAYLAELLSPSTQFASRDIALSVLTASTPALLQLGRRLPDPDEYGRIVAGCIQRHLA